MEISTGIENGALVASVTGRIDGTNAKQFEDDLLARISENSSKVVLDLEGLAYISSAGLRAILLIAKNLSQSDSELLICSLSPSVDEIFKVSGFDRILSTFSSRSKALESLN